MSDLTNLFTAAGEFIPGNSEAMVDISKGGNFGFAPDAENWIGDTPYIRQNLIILLLDAPKFMSLMPNSKNWYAALKAFIETHPNTVTGFDAGLTVEVTESAADASGQVMQAYTKVNRARSNPSFSFEKDVANNGIQKMIQTWIQYGLQSPTSPIPLAITLPDFTAVEASKRNWMANWYSCSYIAIEPNATMTGVIRSYLVTNSFPMGDGGITNQRDMVAGSTVPSFEIAMTAYTTSDEGIDRLAEKLLARISLTNANPNRVIRDLDYSADVASVNDVGYSAGVNKVIADQAP